MGWFGSIQLAYKYGIIFGSLLVTVLALGGLKLLLNRRRLRRYTNNVQFEKPSTGDTPQIQPFRSTEKLPISTVRDAGSLFGVRAIESGYFGGVAQSRCITPPISDHVSSRGSILGSPTPSLKSRNHSTTSLVIPLPPHSIAHSRQVASFSRSGSALSLNGQPMQSSPLARNPFVQDEDEISPCEVKEPSQSHLGTRLNAVDAEAVMINGNREADEKQRGEEVRTRPSSAHSFAGQDEKKTVRLTPSASFEAGELVEEERRNEAALDCSEEEAQIETATIRRMSRFPVVAQASSLPHIPPPNNRASSTYSFEPSKRSSMRSSLSGQGNYSKSHFSFYTNDDFQPEPTSTYRAQSLRSSHFAANHKPPHLDLDFSPIRSSFQSLFALLPSPLRTPSTSSLPGKRATLSTRAASRSSVHKGSEKPNPRFSYQSSERVSRAPTVRSFTRPNSSLSHQSCYRPSGMVAEPPKGLEGSKKIAARQEERREGESKVVLDGQDGLENVIAGPQTPAAPSRVLRRDGERPFFGSGVYERVSKAKRVWLEREGSGKAREVAVEYRLKPSVDPPRVRSPKSPRPPSAVGDWGMDIFQEIDQTITETAENPSSTDGEVVDGQRSAADTPISDGDGDEGEGEEEEEEEEEGEVAVHNGGDGSLRVEARDML